MTFIAIIDLRERRIPNKLTLSGILVATGLNYWISGNDGLTSSITGVLLGCLIVMPGFLLRFTGGGDVKLMAMIGAFLGPAKVLVVFVLTTFIGAALVLLATLIAWFSARPGIISETESDALPSTPSSSTSDVSADVAAAARASAPSNDGAAATLPPAPDTAPGWRSQLLADFTPRIARRPAATPPATAGGTPRPGGGRLPLAPVMALAVLVLFIGEFHGLLG